MAATCSEAFEDTFSNPRISTIITVALYRNKFSVFVTRELAPDCTSAKFGCMRIAEETLRVLHNLLHMEVGASVATIGVRDAGYKWSGQAAI